MSAPTLSRRLEAILAALHPCDTLADVCTDHAFVPLAAVARGLAVRAIGIDRAGPPLAAAAANRLAGGLVDRVALRLGDGLAPLSPGEADALVLAGIGAQLAVQILAACPDRLTRTTQLIVQPNQQPERVRAWALSHGWHLTAETLVWEESRAFHVLAFAPGTGPDPAYGLAGFTPDELVVLGPLLLASCSPEALRLYRAQRDRLARLLKNGPTPALVTEAGLWARAAERREAPAT